MCSPWQTLQCEWAVKVCKQITNIPVLPHAEHITEISLSYGKGSFVENHSSQPMQCLRLSLQNLSQNSEDKIVF